MIQVIISEKTKRNYYELKVVNICKEYKGVETINQFENSFKMEISQVPKKTALTADVIYRTKWVGDQYTSMDAYLEIWHTNSDGVQDRLIATIKKSLN